MIKKNQILSNKFFSIKSDANQKEEDVQIAQQIKNLYLKLKLPNLCNAPSFVQPSEEIYFTHQLARYMASSDFLCLMQQFEFLINELINWSTQHDLENSRLKILLLEVKTRSFDMGIKKFLFFNYGKKQLETLSALLIASEIDTRFRKNVFRQLNNISRNALTVGIGETQIYIQFAHLIQRLKSELEGPNQINHWIHAYTMEIAETVMATRPFAMPESYESLIYRLHNTRSSPTSEEIELWDVRYYLLLRTKTQGFPLSLPEIKNSLEGKYDEASNEHYNNLISSYISDVNNKISAEGLVSYLAARLQKDFIKIMSSSNRTLIDIQFKIEKKLSLLGIDKEFVLTEVLEVLNAGLFRLKENNDLKITIASRLNQGGWFNKNTLIEKKYKVFSKVIHYFYFLDNINLTWFFIEGEKIRYSWTKIIQENYNSLSEIKIQGYYLQQGERTSYLKTLLQIIDSVKDLYFFLSILSNPLVSFPNYKSYTIVPLTHAVQLLQIHQANAGHFNEALRIFLLRLILFRGVLEDKHSIDLIVNLLNHTHDPLLFIKIISILEFSEGKQILNNVDKHVIQKLFFQGINKADITTQFFNNLNADYLLQHGNIDSRKEALQVTQFFLKKLIDNGFNQFDRWEFTPLLHTSYLDGINFFQCSFYQASFYEEIKNCSFNSAFLEETRFNNKISDVSFVRTDLQQTHFNAQNHSSTRINLSLARLSTRTFEQLMRIGVTQFKQADLSKVNLQKIMAGKSLSLDFTEANLSSMDLTNLDFSQILLYGSRISFSLLQGLFFNSNYLDPHTVIQGSHLDVLAILSMYQAGITSFDHCQIIDNGYTHALMRINLEKASFKRAHFIGNLHNFTFQSCDMEGAYFTPLTNYSAQLNYINFYNVNLNKVVFNNIKLANVTFRNCSFSESILKDVELQTGTLFELYQSTYRDFSQVTKLVGKISQKLAYSLEYFPLLEARLSKNVFLHLYQQGLRDFRGSDLTHFKLIDTMRTAGISKFDIRLESARYEQLIARCETGKWCTVHLLLGKASADPKRTIISIEDLKRLLPKSSDSEVHYLDEVLLGRIPFSSWVGNITRLFIYWGHQANDPELTQLIYLLQRSIMQSRINIEIRIYIPQKFKTIAMLITLGRNIAYYLKFGRGLIHYYTQEGVMVALDLTGNPVPIPGYDTLLSNKKFSSILDDVDIDVLRSELNRMKKKLSIYRLIRLSLEKKVAYRFPLSKASQTPYELGRVLMYFIALWEARNSELEISDDIYPPTETPQEIQDANLTLEMQESFHKLGVKLSKEFDLQKACFMKFPKHGYIQNQSFIEYPPLHWHPLPNNTLCDSGRIQKRELFSWSDTPVLIDLIKPIRLIFLILGYDISKDPDFREALLIKKLSQFWSLLDKIGISMDTPGEATLALLQDQHFKDGVFHSTNLTELQSLYKHYLNQTSLIDNYFLNEKTINNITAITDELFSAIRKKRHLISAQADRSNLHTMQMDHCIPWARVGQTYVEGITCYTKTLKTIVFLKDNKVKLERLEDIFSKQSCYPVEFDSRPSVYCEGEKTYIVYTPEMPQSPFEQLDGLLMLTAIMFDQGKKLYDCLRTFRKKAGEASSLKESNRITSNTDEQKTMWRGLLTEIETLLTSLEDANKGKTKLAWARNILEDRQEEFKYLSRQSQLSIEQVNDFTDNLQALQEELEVMIDIFSTTNKYNKKNSVKKIKDIFDISNPKLDSFLLIQKNDVSEKASFTPRIKQNFFGRVTQQSWHTVTPTRRITRV